MMLSRSVDKLSNKRMLKFIMRHGAGMKVLTRVSTGVEVIASVISRRKFVWSVAREELAGKDALKEQR